MITQKKKAAVQSAANLKKLCVHTITTKHWDLETAGEKYAAAGVRGITVWRDALAGRDPAQVKRRLTNLGLSVVALCRGGFFPAISVADRKRAIDDNRRAIADAHALGAPMIVLVCGAIPGMPLDEARRQIGDGIGAVLEDAAAAGIKLAVEPLHPMYADSRSAINTLGQANDLCETIGSPVVGVAVDVYHVWWDPNLEIEITRCGRRGKLFGFHVCDWRTPTTDLLNDRGLMGEGCIPIRKIRSWVEAAGFSGFNEVEIFSTRLWAEDQDKFLCRIVEAYLTHT